MAGVREALVIAVGEYKDPRLSRLHSPSVDATKLEEVLSDPTIGGYSVRTLVDESSYTYRQAIEEFFQNRNLDDLLLLHLSCHGIKDDDGRLHFAASDTRRDLLGSTAVSAGFVNKRMERTRARSVILLLDCCYSGAFRPGSRDDSTVHLGDEFSGTGKAVLTATNAIEYAWDGEPRGDGPVESVFTAAIVSGLQSGEADRNHDGFVSVNDLYDHVLVTTRRSDRQQSPQRWLLGVSGDLRIATNPKHSKVGGLPDDLQKAVHDPMPSTRLEAVDKLENLCRNAGQEVKRRATEALTQLCADTSLRVSTAATQALQRLPSATPEN